MRRARTIARRQYEEAERLLEEALNLEPDNREVRTELATCRHTWAAAAPAAGPLEDAARRQRRCASTSSARRRRST